MNYVLLYLLYRSLINLTCLSQFDFLSASGAQCLKNSEAAELAEFFQSLLHRKISNQAKMLKNQLLQGSLSSAQWSVKHSLIFAHTYKYLLLL